MKPQNKRKVLLINRKFQISILSWFTLLSFFLVGIFYITQWNFFENFANEAIAAGLPADHVFFRYLDAQKNYMNKIFILSSIASFCLIFVGGLFLSHKVAGPLYRLTQHLKNNSVKTVSEVKFRKGDYFMEIQDAFNDFIKRS